MRYCYLFALVLLLFGPLSAQKLHFIPGTTSPAGAHARSNCNFAGTYTLQPFTGQSNDVTPDTIYLCGDDVVQLTGNGDGDLSGDPNPATQPGIGWVLYSCQPSVSGPTLQDLLVDPCLTPGAATGVWAFGDTPNGNVLLTNNGSLQTAFGFGEPVQFVIAPTTFDEFENGALGWESAGVGLPPGPCVHLNTEAALSVVYLNPIRESAVLTSLADDCIGKFRLQGGLPEWDAAAVYTVSIEKTSDPTVKAVVQNVPTQLYHNVDVIFSVPEAGEYTVHVADGKSCGRTFTLNMNACTPFNSVVLQCPDITTAVTPDNTTLVTIPIIVQHMQIGAGSFSMQWDTSELQLLGVAQVHPALGPSFFSSNLNLSYASAGLLGAIVFNSTSIGSPLVIPDGDTLVMFHFQAKGQPGDCSSFEFNARVSQLYFDNPTGGAQACLVENGEICFETVSTAETQGNVAPLKVQPSPVAGGQFFQIILPETSDNQGLLRVTNALGEVVRQANLSGKSMEVSTSGWAAGRYWVAVFSGNKYFGAWVTVY